VGHLTNFSLIPSLRNPTELLLCCVTCRFLIANEFLGNVNTAPLVFPADKLAGGAAVKLPPMQHILDVEVSDEEPEGGAPTTAGADVGAVPDAAAAEPHNKMDATEVGHDGAIAQDEAVEQATDGAAVADDADQEAVVSAGDAAAPAEAAAVPVVGNPEEIVLAE